MSTPTPAPAPVVLLDDIVGDTSHLTKTEVKVDIRGLFVTSWVYTSSKYSGESKPPVIGIHGGPAVAHNYILPLILLADHGHPVILYDQCGCGTSSRVESVSTNAPWLLTLEYYLEELNAIIAAHSSLTSPHGYYVYGSSWGTVVSQEFGVLQPSGLRGLILDGAFCDAQVYIKTQWRDRIGSLPTYTQKLLRKLEDEKAYDSPEYEALNTVLGSHFTTRQTPAPDFMKQALTGMNKEIYVAMQGASEFTVGGLLQNWSITSRLHKINVPTLVMLGQYDTMTEECGQLIVDNVPASFPLLVIPRAAHCKLVDEPLLCIKEMARYLTICETAAARKL